jgi:hypothetical protein
MVAEANPIHRRLGNGLRSGPPVRSRASGRLIARPPVYRVPGASWNDWQGVKMGRALAAGAENSLAMLTTADEGVH